MIILNQELKLLTGESIKESDKSLTLGSALANIMSTSSQDPLRSYSLAKTFYEKPEIELNASDLQFVQQTVESSKLYLALIKGQILEMLK